MLKPVGHAGDLDDFFAWFQEFGSRVYTEVELVGHDALEGWYTDPAGVVSVGVARRGA